LRAGEIGFGGEESAGASFLALDGSTWTTDKDGILLALLASEIKAVTGKSPSELYAELTAEHGAPAYARIDAPANREQKAKLSKLDASSVTATELAGEPITGRHRVGLVCGAAIGHRGRLQDLRRVVQRPRAPSGGPRGGPRGRLGGIRGIAEARIGPGAPRIARRCPGLTNEQTRLPSASERGRQRLGSAILASGGAIDTARAASSK
jgi:hypothetical protein